MQVTVEDVGALTKKLKIVLPEDMVEQKLNEAYNALRPQVSLKGFRKGRVPRKVLERTHGAKVEDEVGGKLIQETYFDALAESKIDVVAHPDIKTQSFEKDGTFYYETEVNVRPEFDLGDYKGLEIERPEVVVTDSEVDDRLLEMQKEMAPLRTVDDRGIRLNDLAVVDFKGYHKGELIKQVQQENHSVDVGSGQNGKEFEAGLIGLKAGMKTSFEVDFQPDFPNPVLAGKKVEFRIEVKAVKERVLADLDDEFAKDAGDEFNTLDDLKAHVRIKIREKQEDAQKGDLYDKIMMKLVDDHKFELPHRLVMYEVNRLIKEVEVRLEQKGINLESAGLNRDDLVDQYKESAERQVRGDFILKKISTTEGIKLSDEDINKGFKRISDQYSMPMEEVKKYFASRDDFLPFMNELLNEQILKFLLDNAVFKYVPADRKNDSNKEETGGDEL